MITALLLIASFVCLAYSHGSAIQNEKAEDQMFAVLALILWALGMLFAFSAGAVL